MVLFMGACFPAIRLSSLLILFILQQTVAYTVFENILQLHHGPKSVKVCLQGPEREDSLRSEIVSLGQDYAGARRREALPSLHLTRSGEKKPNDVRPERESGCCSGRESRIMSTVHALQGRNFGSIFLYRENGMARRCEIPLGMGVKGLATVGARQGRDSLSMSVSGGKHVGGGWGTTSWSSDKRGATERRGKVLMCMMKRQEGESRKERGFVMPNAWREAGKGPRVSTVMARVQEGQEERRVAVVTGAGRGLGLETSRELLSRGYKVVLGLRPRDGGEEYEVLIFPGCADSFSYMFFCLWENGVEYARSR